MNDILINSFKIHPDIIKTVEASENKLASVFLKRDEIKEFNQYKIIHAMQLSRLSDQHFNWTTGYGYNDAGRDKTEEIFARIFETEDALVRPNIVNGTHALSLCLSSLLNPGETMLAITGAPYDTLHELIGLEGNYHKNFIRQNIHYVQQDLVENGKINEAELTSNIEKFCPKVVYIQRSTGYSFRPALSMDDIEHTIKIIKKNQPDIIVMVDNCYGEFLDTVEPTTVGADMMAGSLIKNPGGGIALTGGYIVGKKGLVELAAEELTAPGIGKECGLTFGTTRLVLQGLFLAPTVVCDAVKGAMLAALVFQNEGYIVNPGPFDQRSDIIQSIQLNNSRKLTAFCKGIQEAAPVDSFATPLPWDMPGYHDQVIMAAGSFVQGSSIELSADGPMRPPYNVYFQGGLTYSHAKLGVMKALSYLRSL